MRRMRQAISMEIVSTALVATNQNIPCKKELIHHEKDFYRSVRIESRAGMVYYNLYEGKRLRMVRGASVVGV